MTKEDGGVFISDSRCAVRLGRSGPPNELGYPTRIDIRAGPFQGSILDETVGFDGFREQLAALYESLHGEASLKSYEGFALNVRGDGRGGIEVHVKAIGEHVPPIQLTFSFCIDQSYLPTIIQQIVAEFPPPYRASID